jgi:uncharacterized protein YqeY
MTLLETIEKDYLTAYKAREEVKVAVLRMLKTAIKNKTVELGREPEDGEVLELVTRQVKQRRESIDQFTKAGRDDLVARETVEMEALAAYLPSQLDAGELGRVIDDIISETGAGSMKEMGAVMGALAARFKGRYDGKAASDLVRSKLTT